MRAQYLISRMGGDTNRNNYCNAIRELIVVAMHPVQHPRMHLYQGCCQLHVLTFVVFRPEKLPMDSKLKAAFALLVLFSTAAVVSSLLEGMFRAQEAVVIARSTCSIP